jgi:GntR family transcriptional regulator
MTTSVLGAGRARKRPPRRLQTSPHRAHNLLRSGIRTGMFSGDAALVEDALIRALSTSRNAVRQALQMLAAEGLVDRRPNRGTTVIATICDIAVDQLVPTTAFGEPGATVRQLDHRTIPGDTYVRTRLALAGTEAATTSCVGADERAELRVDMSETLISRDSTPISLRVSYVPAGDGPVVRVLEVVPVPEAFLRVFGRPLGSTEASIGAIAAGAGVARLLGLSEGAPVLVQEVLLRDVDGRPRELSYTYHRADRVSVSVHQAATESCGTPAVPSGRPC